MRASQLITTLKWMTCLSLMVKSLVLLWKVTSYKSIFPADILEEMAEMDFEKFNHNLGTYQSIVPRVVHFFHYSQDSELKFWEAAAVRAAVALGGADSVYIHSLEVTLTGRYREAFDTEELREIIFFNVMAADEKLPPYWRQRWILGVVREMGGIVLPPGTLLLDKIEDLLRFEFSIYSPPASATSASAATSAGTTPFSDGVIPPPDGAFPSPDGASSPAVLMMASMGARLTRAAIEVARLQEEQPPAGPLAVAIADQPTHAHLFHEGVLAADSPLLNSIRGADLARILDHRIVLMDPSRLDGYTDLTICEQAGSIPALLRRVWYGTYSFVEPNSTQPALLIKDSYEL